MVRDSENQMIVGERIRKHGDDWIEEFKFR
jgi:hypothetical protein